MYNISICTISYILISSSSFVLCNNDHFFHNIVFSNVHQHSSFGEHPNSLHALFISLWIFSLYYSSNTHSIYTTYVSCPKHNSDAVQEKSKGNKKTMLPVGFLIVYSYLGLPLPAMVASNAHLLQNQQPHSPEGSQLLQLPHLHSPTSPVRLVMDLYSLRK